ncbi:MAG: TonB-dependent receptor, partial [Rhodothermales bacterium]
MRLVRLLLFTFALLIPATAALAQTGRISGRITDASSGEALPGVNVSIEGTTQGSVTDVEGYYSIINVRPGAHDVRASFIGFTPIVQEDVRVSVGLTTDLDFELREETVGLEEVIVSAQRPIVQLDVSANVATLTPEEFVDLPVAGVSEVLDLQAGIEPGLQVRGGGLSELAFIMDGLNLRTGRDNSPFTNISYTALEEVQVQTGGFNAEYGNVRAGVINVTTKEPSRTRFTFDGLFRFTPAQDRSFNALSTLPANCDYSNELDLDPNCDSYWVRPLLDPAVNLAGTGAWDQYTQRQYNSFSGLNAAAATLQGLGFDVAPQELIEYYRYTHRKNLEVESPDYQADFTLGGPLVPGISEKLGDLRFLLSYRGSQTAYIV